MTIFRYSTTVAHEWIDYNGHMQDAYYGLIFSFAVDGVQDEIGLDAAYRKATGCTVFVTEDHKFFLKEVKEGAKVQVETRVLDCDDSRFHLHMTMISNDEVVSVCEALEVHVNTLPKPHVEAMPSPIRERLIQAKIAARKIEQLRHRSRTIWRNQRA